MDDREHFRIQMMGFLDDELDDESRRKFIEYCYADPVLATELAQYRRLSAIAGSMRLREPEDYEYERFFARISARIERRLAFTLFFVGVALLSCWGVTTLLLSSFSVIVKIAVAVTLLGVALLVSSVVRAWIRVRRLDRYQGVRR